MVGKTFSENARAGLETVHINAPIAQLVEQWTFNPTVVCSIQTGGTNSNLSL